VYRFAELTESSLHTLQVLLPYLPHEDVFHVAEIRAAQLLTCPPEGLLTIAGIGAKRGSINLFRRAHVRVGILLV